MSETRSSGAPPRSERCIDGATLVFAVFTLCTHAVVAAGGSLQALLLVLPPALAAAGLGWRRIPRSPALPALPPPPQSASPAPRLVGLAIAAAAVLWLPGDATTRWWCAVGLLGPAALWVARTQPPRPVPAARGGREEGALWGLAAAAAALALVAHRFDIDDAFYVNLAVAIADDPGAPLLARDTLHGLPGLPLHLPVYRVHSYEVWNAALSWLSRLPAILSFHLVSAALAAAAVPLATARLARRLLPGHWLFLTLAVLVVLLAMGDTQRSPGNFALVRIWQGKAIALSVFLPLVASTALDLVARPDLRRFLLLAAAQIAALGCTSSAVWLAPAVAIAAGAAAAPISRRGLLRLALVVLSAAYLLGAGWQMKQAIVADEAAVSAERVLVERGTAQRSPPGARLEVALVHVLGRERLPGVVWAAVWSTWALLPAGLGRRFAVTTPLLALVVALNPYTSDAVVRYATGYSYWRALWALPIPWLVALAASAPLAVLAARSRPLALGASAAALLAFATAVPERWTLAPANGVAFDLPRAKVREVPYAQAAALSEALPAGARVIVPRPVAQWLVTFHDRLHPYVVRDAYLQRYVARLGEAEVARRIALTRFVEGRPSRPGTLARFARALERDDVRGVVLRGFEEGHPARRILRRAGFAPIHHGEGGEVWVRR